MASLCPAPNPDLGLVKGLMGTVDCNVGTLTREGYGLLAAPNSTVMALTVSLMTMYVAFIGYRMLLGRAPLRVGEMTMSAIKIGVVIALASNWGVYQTVVYDTLFKAPTQLAGMMLSAVQPEGSVFRGNPFEGLQIAFDQLSISATTFSGRAGTQASPFTGGVGFGAFALNSSAFLLLLSSLGVILASKIVLALLLALAPLVAGLLLFEATRGVVEGWLKASVAFAIAPFLATLLLALQLTMLEPSLLALAAMREQGRTDVTPAIGAFVLTLVFAAVLAGASLAALMLAKGVRLPRKGAVEAASEARPVTANANAVPAEMQTRVAAVAAAAAAMERRDTQSAAGRASVVSMSERRITVSGERAPASAAPSSAIQVQPLGQSYRRAAAPRRSASASRRDR